MRFGKSRKTSLNSGTPIQRKENLTRPSSTEQFSARNITRAREEWYVLPTEIRTQRKGAKIREVKTRNQRIKILGEEKLETRTRTENSTRHILRGGLWISEIVREGMGIWYASRLWTYANKSCVRLVWIWNWESYSEVWNLTRSSEIVRVKKYYASDWNIARKPENLTRAVWRFEIVRSKPEIGDLTRKKEILRGVLKSNAEIWNLTRAIYLTRERGTPNLNRTHTDWYFHLLRCEEKELENWTRSLKKFDARRGVLIWFSNGRVWRIRRSVCA